MTDRFDPDAVLHKKDVHLLIAEAVSNQKTEDQTEYAVLIENVNTVATSGVAQTIPVSSVATMNRITLTADCVLTFPTVVEGASFTLVLAQDDTGGWSVTWPASVKWLSGTAPTLTDTADAVDWLCFSCVDGATWAGFVSGLDVK